MNKHSFVSNNIDHKKKAILFLEKMALLSNQQHLLSFYCKNNKYYFEYKKHQLFFYRSPLNQIYFGVVHPTGDETLFEIPQEYQEMFNEVVYPEKVLDEILNSDSYNDNWIDSIRRKVSKFFNH